MDFAGFTIRGFGVVMMTLAFAIWPCWATCPVSSMPLMLDNAKGDWYVLAVTPMPDNTIKKCSNFAVMKISDDEFCMIFETLSPKNNEPVRFHLDGKNDYDMKSTWQEEGTNRILGVTPRIISATRKYDEYMVMVVCPADKTDISPTEFGMILSRKSSLPTEELTMLKKRLSEYFPLEKIIDVDHTDCETIY